MRISINILSIRRSLSSHLRYAAIRGGRPRWAGKLRPSAIVVHAYVARDKGQYRSCPRGAAVPDQLVQRQDRGSCRVRRSAHGGTPPNAISFCSTNLVVTRE